MNDHQDSEHFTYTRTWVEIESMLDKAERKQNQHYMMLKGGKRKERIHHMRNYKALEGVIKALRWTLGDIKVKSPLN